MTTITRETLELAALAAGINLTVEPKPKKATAAEVKEAAGYSTKPRTCRSCQHYTSQRELPAWMREENERRKNSLYSIKLHGVEKKLRCSLHGFPVSPGGWCPAWSKKP